MELRVEILDRTTGAVLHRDRFSLYGGHTFVVPQFPVPIEVRASVHPQNFADHHNTLYEMLKYGVKANYVDAADDGTVRQSVDYIKGFQEGAQTVIEHAESRLVGFLRYFKSLPHGLEETVRQVLDEWEHFKGRR